MTEVRGFCADSAAAFLFGRQLHKAQILPGIKVLCLSLLQLAVFGRARRFAISRNSLMQQNQRFIEQLSSAFASRHFAISNIT